MTSAVRTIAPRGLAASGLAAVGALAGAATAQRPAVTLVAVVACIAAAAVIVWPETITLAVVFLMYANVPAVLVKSHGLPRMAAALVPVLLAVPLAFHLYRRARLHVDRTFLLLLVYLVAQVLSAFFSSNQHDASQKLKTFILEGVVLYALVTNVVRTPTMLRRAVWAIVGAASLLATTTIFQHLTGTYSRPYGGFSLVDPSYFVGQSASPRASGPIGDPNYYAQILLVALALALPMCWREPSRNGRLAARAATGLLALGVVFTYSRGAGLAFLVLLVLTTFLRYLTARQLLAIAVGVSVLVMAFPDYRSRVATVVHLGGATKSAGSQGAADVSARSRATEMLAAALVFADHPVLGVGPAVFPDYYQQYAARIGLETHDSVKHGKRQGELAQRQSHNMFLSIAADVGLLGLLAFVSVIGSTLWTLARARRRWLAARPDLSALATGCMLALIAYLITGLFLTLAYERYFWLLIALSGAAGTLATRGEETREPAA